MLSYLSKLKPLLYFISGGLAGILLTTFFTGTDPGSPTTMSQSTQTQTSLSEYVVVNYV